MFSCAFRNILRVCVCVMCVTYIHTYIRNTVRSVREKKFVGWTQLKGPAAAMQFFLPVGTKECGSGTKATTTTRTLLLVRITLVVNYYLCIFFEWIYELGLFVFFYSYTFNYIGQLLFYLNFGCVKKFVANLNSLEFYLFIYLKVKLKIKESIDHLNVLKDFYRRGSSGSH